MKTTLFSLPFLVLLVACQSNTPKANLKTKIDGSEIWIDVRTPREYQSDHVTDSKNWEYQTAVDSIKKYHPELDKKLFLYCRSGRRAGIVESQLQSLGYKNISNVRTLEAGKSLTQPMGNSK